jgi:hypothetical protein
VPTKIFKQALPAGLPDDDGGYSDFWRVNKYYNEPYELASVLRALRKVAGHVGMNVGTVMWSGMSSTPPPNLITVNPDFVYGAYPVSADKIDLLIGAVVHEAFHQKEWSDLVWQEMEKCFAEKGIRDIKEKDMLWKIFNTGEDIYIDQLAGKSVLGLYVKKTRNFLFARLARNLSSPPGIEVLFELWKRRVLDDPGYGGAGGHYELALQVLCAPTPDFLERLGANGSVVERCKFRAEFYLSLWDELKDEIGSWRVDKITYFPQVGKAAGDRRGAKTLSGRSQIAMPVELSAQIEQHLARISADLTPLIREICGGDPDVLPTIVWDSNVTADACVDPYLVARLKIIFQAYADRIKIKNRGLSAGVIDRSRLYRAETDGNCFFNRQMNAVPGWSFVILVDASMSMRGYRWNLVKNTVAALYKAIEGSGNKIAAFAYHEHDGVVVVSRLIKDGKLYSITPSGRTPSGQAIIAAALLMDKEPRRKFIIHVTDGESNCGCSVNQALEHCSKEKIDLVTLGCGYKEKELLIKQYGKYLQFLDFFEQLPKALESLLIRKLLLNR